MSRWLVLSDIHFRHRDLDRTIRTAQWIASLPRRFQISRVVISGDLLTTRTTQPTDVLSATYRFLNELSASVPHVNVLLGNHDLAYKRDYATSALNALDMKRLSPFVSLHHEVGSHEWDGRRVLVLPFREDQSELTEAVKALDPREASRTVAFAHLALNRAITQRHIIRPATGDAGFPVTYSGLTGPSHFSALARTFTGHFHSHQTLLQDGSASLPPEDPRRLQGSVTYIGAPLQLTWADLHDEQRGVLLLDPVSLEHQLIVNPHAVAYVTADLVDVLQGKVDPENVTDRHVMLVGALTRFTYLTARDKLLSLGALSVREWAPVAPMLHRQEQGYLQGLGATAPASDAGILRNSAEFSRESPATELGSNLTTQQVSSSLDAPEPSLEVKSINPTDFVQDYITDLELDTSLDRRREALVSLGQRIIQAAEQSDGSAGDPSDDSVNVSYRSLLDSAGSTLNQASGQVAKVARHVFVARPRSLTIRNFLGVQESLTVEFGKGLPPGLNFIVGANGAGKSTLFEAIVWCQFGRCTRSGLTTNDVVNDTAGKDCSVSLTFENGYTIQRYRKDKTYGNRIMVLLHGQEQKQFEKPTARSTQAAIDELLGIDYDAFVRTVMLGHESAEGFLNSSPVQRREIVESLLGLASLDAYGNLSRQMLKDCGTDDAALRSKRDGNEQTMRLINDRIEDHEQALQSLAQEEKRLSQTLRKARDEQVPHHDENSPSVEELTSEATSNDSLEIADVQREIEDAAARVRAAELRDAFQRREAATRVAIREAEDREQHLQVALNRASEIEIEPISPRETQALRDIVGILRSTERWLSLGVDSLKSLYQTSLPKAPARAAIHFIQVAIMGLRNTIRQAEQTRTRRPNSKRLALKQQQHEATLAEIRQDIARAEARFQELRSFLKDLTRHVSEEEGVGEAELLKVVEDTEIQDTKSTRNRLSKATKHLSMLMTRQVEQQDKQRRFSEKDTKRREAALVAAAHEAQLSAELAGKQQEMTTFSELLAKEEALLQDLLREQSKLNAEIEELASAREMFSFWESAFSKRRVKASDTTFRSYILENSLGDLNDLVTPILALLYQETHHAESLTSGVLRSLLDSDRATEDEEGGGNGGGAGAADVVLNKTLTVNPTLSYPKRSGGERKRIDLALFFGLMQLSQMRSAHRAHYILVDEVFDSLDAAGQAVVVAWADYLMPRVEYRLVITHSPQMMGRSPRSSSGRGVDDDDEDEGGNGVAAVVTARMGKKGTEIEISKRDE
ncbi:P-loop containing nucleoside triphosphate hydrolase protein [Xylariaceae sp. FL0804]|nr:P-loop containing nucleoside triphosphate hydrolase protein [Xylariaceae sp. FL0804]